ncbi:MAG: transposase [Acetobacteraceae bacterium]|jgi:hypothetical protein
MVLVVMVWRDFEWIAWIERADGWFRTWGSVQPSGARHEPAGFSCRGQCAAPTFRRRDDRAGVLREDQISLDESGVAFRYKDYRRDGARRYRTMTLATDEFIRRFPLHVLLKGFHRMRHYGRLASAGRKANVARARALLAVPPVVEPAEPVVPTEPRPPWPRCCGRMVIIETFQRWRQPRTPTVSPAPTGMAMPWPGTAGAYAMSLLYGIGHRHSLSPAAGPHR